MTSSGFISIRRWTIWVAQGWSPDAARQEAERQFGDVTRLRKMGEQLGQSHERRRRLTAFAREAPRR